MEDKKQNLLGAKDSGISDFDSDFKRRVRSARRAVPLSNRTNDDYTPITNLGDLGPAISAIKRGQDRTADAVDTLSKAIDKDIKPKLDKVHEGFIRLETEHRVTKARLKSVEGDTKALTSASPQPHDCYHEDDFIDLKDGQRSVLADVITIKTGLVEAATEHKRTKEMTDKEVDRIDGRSKTVTGIAVTVILFVLGAAGAASAAFYTTQERVGHIAEEQSKMRDEMAATRSASVSASTKVESAATKMEQAANQVRTTDHAADPLELVWCDLSPQERRRQENLRGRDKIPQRRCP
jgi:hypothetical protein